MSEVNRRLAAILAADVVSYSAQIGADEPATIARVRALRSDVIEPVAAAHGGRLFKTMGDGFLLEFASAVQALRCAIAIQTAVNAQDGLRLRIGVHQGEVVPDGDDLLGDGVIVAARLEPLAEHGGIVISSRVREDASGKMPLDVEDLGEPPLKNIAARIRVFRVRLGATEPVKADLALPDKPSIAVLAFTNMSGDADQEYFADGIAEDIITALSHIRWLFVIARNSSFTYKGKAVDIKQVGRELGVRYVLEGSVRRAGNRLRITGQLIEAATGTHVWAERYDRTMDDIFAVQDEITEAVVTAIEPAMANVERWRAGQKAPGGLGTWELYHRALWHFYKFTAEENLRAFEFLEQAKAQDPDNASIHAALALVCLNRGWQFVSRDDETWIGLALDHGRIAIGRDPRDANPRATYANALGLSGKHEEALRESTQAVALHPNNSMAQGVHATVLAYYGRPAEALPHLDLALRLNPVDPYRFIWIHVSCTASYLMGDYESCLRSGQDLCRMQPTLFHGYRAILVALAELGRATEASQYAEIIFTKFNREMTAFLTVRYPEFREIDYNVYCASVAKAGLVPRDGGLVWTGQAAVPNV